jgi:hypothetical protein
MDYRTMITELINKASDVQLKRLYHFIRAYLA